MSLEKLKNETLLKSQSVVLSNGGVGANVADLGILDEYGSRGGRGEDEGTKKLSFCAILYCK